MKDDVDECSAVSSLDTEPSSLDSPVPRSTVYHLAREIVSCVVATLHGRPRWYCWVSVARLAWLFGMLEATLVRMPIQDLRQKPAKQSLVPNMHGC